MNILVTGACGQLGCWMRLVSRVSTDNYIFSDIAELNEESAAMLERLGGSDVDTDTLHLDITDEAAVGALVASRGIGAIVNCAAYTNVEAAETNASLAEKLNADAPAVLARAMKAAGGLLVHISTDYVFGKEPYNTPCCEDMSGTPTGIYGLTKLRGEQNIIASGCRHIIIRTAWLYSEFGKNFCRTMLALTASKPSLRVVFDQAGTPTYAADLAALIHGILEKRLDAGHEGIYHYSDEGVCSWFDFARTIGEMSGHGSCSVLPCHSDEFPSAVVRPAYSVLDKTLVKETFGVVVPYWTDSLRICIDNLSARDIEK